MDAPLPLGLLEPLTESLPSLHCGARGDDSVAGSPVAFTVVQRPSLSFLSEASSKRGGLAARYGLVSVINVVNHQILLNLANSGWGWSGGRSNVFAAIVAAVPGYLLSRHWVWEVRGPHSLSEEILPFWSLAVVGLVLSTILAEGADRIFGSGIPVALASLVGYFVVWVAKFLLLDRLFNRSADRLEQVATP